MSYRHDPFARPPWEPEDSKTLLQFLATRTGKRLVFRLQNDRPRLGGSRELQSSMEANALWAKEVRGYEEAVRNLFLYTSAPVEEQARAEAYPSLDAEENWGEDLQTPAPLKAPELQNVPNEAEASIKTEPEELIPGGEVPKPIK